MAFKFDNSVWFMFSDFDVHLEFHIFPIEPTKRYQHVNFRALVLYNADGLIFLVFVVVVTPNLSAPFLVTW